MVVSFILVMCIVIEDFRKICVCMKFYSASVSAALCTSKILSVFVKLLVLLICVFWLVMRLKCVILCL